MEFFKIIPGKPGIMREFYNSDFVDTLIKFSHVTWVYIIVVLSFLPQLKITLIS